MSSEKEGIAALRLLVDEAEKAAIFTGAGISTESGIPDFRSPGGIWSKYKPIQFQDFMASEEMRRESWRRKIQTDGAFAAAKPNRGHRAVSHLVAQGKVTAVITQNVDGLHQASGIPENKIIELHGNATYAKCLRCDRRHELEAILEKFKKDEIPPVCDDCGGIVKTATISFGQSMPEEEMIRAREATMNSDLFIVMGSSLVVFPAAGFPLMAKENGAKLIIVNRDSTDMDSFADLVVHESIGETLGEALGVD